MATGFVQALIQWLVI